MRKALSFMAIISVYMTTLTSYEASYSDIFAKDTCIEKNVVSSNNKHADSKKCNCDKQNKTAFISVTLPLVGNVVIPQGSNIGSTVPFTVLSYKNFIITNSGVIKSSAGKGHYRVTFGARAVNGITPNTAFELYVDGAAVSPQGSCVTQFDQSGGGDAGLSSDWVSESVIIHSTSNHPSFAIMCPSVGGLTLKGSTVTGSPLNTVFCTVEKID